MTVVFPLPTVAATGAIQSSWGNTVRDDFGYLLNRPAQIILLDHGANYTNSTTGAFNEIDGTNLKITLANKGSLVWLWFQGVVSGSLTTSKIDFDFTVDGVRVGAGGLNGLFQFCPPNSAVPNGISYAALALVTPGSHVFKPVWSPQAGAATLYCGAGVAGTDYLAQFGAMEVA